MCKEIDGTCVKRDLYEAAKSITLEGELTLRLGEFSVRSAEREVNNFRSNRKTTLESECLQDKENLMIFYL